MNVVPYAYGAQPYNYPSKDPEPLKLCCSNTPDIRQSQSIQYDINNEMKCPAGMTFYKVTYGHTSSDNKYIPTQMNCAPMKINNCKWVPTSFSCNIVNYSLIWENDALQASYVSKNPGEDPNQYTILVNGSWQAASVFPKSANQTITYSYSFYILSNNINDPPFCIVTNQKTNNTFISNKEGIQCPEVFDSNKDYMLYLQVKAADMYQNNQIQKSELAIHLGNH